MNSYWRIISILVITLVSHQAMAADFSINLVPKHPEPNSEAIIKINASGVDLDRSAITWIIDGKTVEKGTGKKSIHFTMPDLGKTSKITAYVTPSSGYQKTQTLRVTGHDIDILWEAQTYTPSWYQGKALPVLGSEIKFTAIPHFYSSGSLLSRSSLIYDWYLNYKKMIQSSGTGKNSFTLKNNGSNEHTVSVVVSSPGGSIEFEKTIILPVKTKTKIIFYEESPLLGTMFNNTLKGVYNLVNNLLRLKVEPFYFSKGQTNQLSYQWKMNDKNINWEEQPDIMDLEKSSDASGVATINLEIKNLINLFQTAQGNLKINF
ncbi:hypothetical protein ACFL1O_00165 [Patescibacteria group bacterium]